MLSVKMRFKYADAETRLYDFDCEDSLAADVKDNIMNVNDSLLGGTAGGLESFFVSDGGASLAVIDGATLESVFSESITIAPNS